LLALEGADDRLSLYRADVLNYDSLRVALSGCHGVFHIASPVSNDPVGALLLLCSLPRMGQVLT
jgi:cinnamoyl-CoA reductase